MNPRKIIFAVILAIQLPGLLVAEVTSTTTSGISTRTNTFKFENSSTDEDGFDEGQSAEETQELSGLFLCEKISATSNLGIEFGVNGCMQKGGLKTFMTILSVHLTLAYYPLSSKYDKANDVAVDIASPSRFQLYILGVAGFSKITTNQTDVSNLSIATDTVDFGGGLGVSMSLTENISIVGEGIFLTGAILSSFATGSTSHYQIGGGIKVKI